MKLSEAILLGSTVVAPKAGAMRFSGENAGCALGMAAVARGCTFSPVSRQIPAKDLRTLNAEHIWGTWLLRMVIRPCDCPTPIALSSLRLKDAIAYLFRRGSPTLPPGMRIKDIIAHLFDHHVMGKTDWTLDQLVAWVEKWEPREPGRSTLIADLGRRPFSANQSRDLSEEEAEWQRTRDTFEAKVKGKRRPSSSAR